MKRKKTYKNYYQKKKAQRMKYVRVPKEYYTIKTVTLYCNICGEEFKVHTSNIKIYTEEVKKNYVCWKCKDDRFRKLYFTVLHPEKKQSVEVIAKRGSGKSAVIKELLEDGKTKKEILKLLIEKYPESKETTLRSLIYSAAKRYQI